MRAALERARDQADRAAEIILRLRELTRKQNPGVGPIDLNALIDTVLELSSREIKQLGIAVTTRLAPAIPTVQADRIQIEQVLLNLTRNAIEALRDAAIAAPRLILATNVEKEFISIQVEDNGGGLRLEDREKVFEAFFTTKSEGMGMGLSISRTIIENHQGRLWAEPTPNGGARFHVQLPKTAPQRNRTRPSL